jgi:hypothetical protein
MDLNALPFDAEDMLRGLRPWIECESPTWDARAVNRMMRLAARDLAVMGARIEPIAGRMGFGDCLRATFPHPAPASRASSSSAISTPSIRSARSTSCPSAATAPCASAPASST